jgi:hypothetical protein
MNPTIPLLGGVPLAAGRVPFSFSKLSTHRAKSGYFSKGKMRSLSKKTIKGTPPLIPPQWGNSFDGIFRIETKTITRLINRPKI